MLIQVTQECIDNGKRGLDWLCPVAVALLKNGYNCPKVMPWLDDVQICFYTGNSLVSTSCWLENNDMYQKLTRYDEQGEMEPFSFEMPLQPNGKPSL